MEITFKVAATADLDTLVVFVLDFYEYDQHRFDEAVVRAALTGFLNDETLGQTWLVLADGEAVGYMVLTLGYSLNHPGREAFVDEIFIQEGYRQRGIGRRAIAFAEAWGRTVGVRALHDDSYLMTKWIDT